MSELIEVEEGDRVRAMIQVLEEGPGGTPNPDAKPCETGWVHAEPGDLGTVVHVEPGLHPTVRFDKTKTATCVMVGQEVELYTEESR